MMHRRHGFTLIEIMLVVAIMAILATIAMPRMRASFSQARLKRAARDVAGMMRFARNTAVLRELPCEVRFDPENGKYQLVLLDEYGDRIDDADGRRYRNRKRAKENPELSMGDDIAGVRRLPDGVYFAVIYSGAEPTEDTDLPRLIYYSDGSATAGTIAIQDDKEHALHVEVFRTTGMARVAPGLPVREPEGKTLYYGPKK